MDSDAEAEEIASDDEIQAADEDQAYSVDFEEDIQPSPAKPSAKPAPAAFPAKQTPPPPVKQAPPPPQPVKQPTKQPVEDEPEYDDDFENEDDGGYGDASFENESRSSSPRHHVNLSVPTRPPSPPRTYDKKPEPPPSPRPLARIEEEPIDNAKARETNRYIRQLEVQLVDENDQLKFQHAQLLRANSDLKNELRFHQERHLEEKRLRSEKFAQKKKRADERRLQHELLLQTTKQTLADVEAKYIALDARLTAEVQAHAAVVAKFALCESEKRQVEERNLHLSESYEAALRDLHTLNGKLENAVDARQQLQQKYEQAVVDHRVAIEVVEQRCLVKLQCMEETMTKAMEERSQERVALPENYRLIVEAQRERYEKLEAKLLEDKREMEDKAKRERERYEKALALAQSQRIQAEERADAKIRDEAIKVFRERDAIDDQRRQLLTSLATQNARLDEERGRLEALRTQLEEKRLRLVQDEITVEAQAKQCQERLTQLARDEDIVNARKREVMALSATTLEQSRQYSELVQKLDKLQVEHRELNEKYEALSRKSKEQQTDQDHKWQLVEREKAALERANAALQHEKLLLTKQRMECRQMMEGTRKLDYLLRQQAALGNVYVHPPTSAVKMPPWTSAMPQPTSWNIAYDADKEATMY
ncbi:hypothetical protein LEN26_017600 [Aphanomyces euteiches]|nr:hypothetical protein LEN26_017600 [Aphanomyces euteiches]KAH9105999.1 hypothetical protein AeMF1_018294 [Aphanomyces euteiches]KAH9196971.1 hypothetical protein AeNC1_001050 [Aphanomyces euteiches]